MKQRTTLLLLTLAGAALSGARASAQADFPNASAMSAIVTGFQDQARRQRALPQRPPAAAPGSAIQGAPDVSRYTIRGVDVSHKQNRIDWVKAKRYGGISFAYIKATEGGDTVDQRFAENWRNAGRADVLRGAYHFYSFCRGGSAQARNFIKTAPAEAGALPPMLDLEKSGDCKTMPSPKAFRKDFAAYVQKIQIAYGVRPILYVNRWIYDEYFQGTGDLSQFKIWICDKDHRSPDLPFAQPWTVWQYDFHGHVPGIENGTEVDGQVDLDVYRGTPDGLAALTRPDADLFARAP